MVCCVVEVDELRGLRAGDGRRAVASSTSPRARDPSSRSARRRAATAVTRDAARARRLTIAGASCTSVSAGSTSLSEPERKPARSSATYAKPSVLPSATIDRVAGARRRAAARRLSTSSRAIVSWKRTRSWLKPSARRPSSNSSTRRSRSGVICVPYGNRDDRHASCGLSHVAQAELARQPRGRRPS